MRGLVLPFAVASFVAVGGCGSTGAILNTPKIDGQIAQLVSNTVGRSVVVSCPDNVPASKGRVTVCAVKAADGSRAPAQIRQTNADGAVSFYAPILHTPTVERSVAEGAKRQMGIAIHVTCQTLVVMASVMSVPCEGTDPHGVAHAIVARVTSSGDVSFRYTVSDSKIPLGGFGGQ